MIRTILDDTLSGGPHERTITYETPFTRPTREHDYHTAWTTFTHHFRVNCAS